MKRAKIVLTAITVFAVVGVALAFKAKPLTARNVYCLASACTTVNWKTNFESNVATTDDPCGVGGAKTFYTSSDCPSTVTGTVYAASGE